MTKIFKFGPGSTAAAARFFFGAGGDFRASPFDHPIHVPPNEMVKFPVAIDGFLHGLGLLSGNIAGDVFAVLAKLMIIIGAVGALANDGQFAAFQMLDLGCLSHERLELGLGIHG
jgi:hypothetical protein